MSDRPLPMFMVGDRVIYGTRSMEHAGEVAFVTDRIYIDNRPIRHSKSGDTLEYTGYLYQTTLVGGKKWCYETTLIPYPEEHTKSNWMDFYEAVGWMPDPINQTKQG